MKDTNDDIVEMIHGVGTPLVCEQEERIRSTDARPPVPVHASASPYLNRALPFA